MARGDRRSQASNRLLYGSRRPQTEVTEPEPDADGAAGEEIEALATDLDVALGLMDCDKCKPRNPRADFAFRSPMGQHVDVYERDGRVVLDLDESVGRIADRLRTQDSGTRDWLETISAGTSKEIELAGRCSAQTPLLMFWDMAPPQAWRAYGAGIFDRRDEAQVLSDFGLDQPLSESLRDISLCQDYHQRLGGQELWAGADLKAVLEYAR